jgi:carboxypeptidase Taq
MLSVQLWNKALQEVPSIPEDIRQGNFAPLLNWLRQNVHCYGRKYFPAELVQRVTGGPIQSEPLMGYLRAKFGAIYGL